MHRLILKSTIVAGLFIIGTPSVSAHIVAGEDSISCPVKKKNSFVSRLSLGGYGEVAYTRNFFSDNVKYMTKI